MSTHASHADWNLALTADGSPTFVHPVHGQACHSRAGAWQESRERYAQACRLRELALAIAARRVHANEHAALRLLDVGTGLGMNLAAALEALDGTGVRLRVVSLECDVRVIEATLALAGDRRAHVEAWPAALVRWHAPVREALARALDTRSPDVVEVGMLALELVIGDGRVTLPALAPSARFDAVFLDPFSPAVDPPLWEPVFLREVARRMASGSLLSTYTASMRVRAALAAAGLKVGPGARVGTKAHGTIASPDRPLEPFDPRTERRLAARADGLAARARGLP